MTLSPATLPLRHLGLGICLSLLMVAATPLYGQESGPAERIAAAQRVRMQYARNDAQLKIANVRPSADSVELFHRFELSFDIEGRFENPFDPDQIRVDAQITRPDGSVITVPAFFMAEYESADGKTRLQGDVDYKPSTGQGWRLRYAPTQAGEHQVVLIAEQADGSQKATAPAVRFTAAVSDHAGYVRVSERNPRYFEYAASGELFYPVGVNVPWTRTTTKNPELGAPHGTYEHYFSKARGNMSATRVWQCHYAWLEWMPVPGQDPNNSWSGYGGMNYYNQMVAAAFDRVFELGEQADLRIMLVLDDNDEHSGPADNGPPHAWAFNPYNKLNGGPAEKPHDRFISSEARQAYRKRLRYIAARWGYSPSLWAINTWNDMNNPSPETLDWLREMHGYTHELFDGWRPIIFGTNFKFAAQQIPDYSQPAQPLPTDKPSVIQEVYFTRNTKWFIDTLRLELWQAMSRGHGGVMTWPHGMVDRYDAWDCFASMHRFMQGLRLHEQKVQPAEARVVAANVDTAGDATPQRVIALVNYGDIARWGARATEDHFVIDPTAGNQFLEGISPKLYGVRHPEWRTEPTFEFNLPARGEFIIEMGMQISGPASMKLVVTDNGQPATEFTFPGSERRSVPNESKFLRIPLSAGSHSLKLSLEGPNSDWIDIRRYLIVYDETDSTRLVNVDGLASDQTAILVLRNVTVGELPEDALGQTPAKIRDVEVEVANLPDGVYDVIVWDINTGQPRSTSTATATGGKVRVQVGDVVDHAAIKILRKS